jgi:glycosyltransferase involved in cell wall biosynthesis
MESRSQHKTKAIGVRYIYRRPSPGHQYFSIERFFGDISRNLPAGFVASSRHCSFFSQGVLRRILIMLQAAWFQGEVTHVTGDINFAVALLRKRRTVLTILDLHWINDCKGLTRWLRRIVWARMPAARAQIVTVISEATKRDVLAQCNVDPGKIRVIPCCLSPEFKHVPKVFDSSMPTILQVGTRSNKNLERVIEAVAGIPCHLRVIGSLTPRQRELMKLHHVGYSNAISLSDSDIVSEYRAADVVVFASLAEGFGLPIVEAQGTGRIVVTSDRAPMTEVAGAGAIYIDPLSIRSIREGLLRAIVDPDLRERTIAAGLKNAARFSAQSVAAQYAAVYRELADG